ncbi:MAG: DUF1778 domain-containing protein [Syntrophobacteraceae bacterium]|nr:DUF1778 domain-containing protein [Syntrophobacteraceae bacterium]
MNPETNQRIERIDIRTTPNVKRLLQEAAAVSNKTVTEFLLDSALTQAAEVLADRRLFLLDDKQWEEFIAALDAPPRPMPGMERLLREPSILEQQSPRNDQ